jgi:hypothetical protein
MNEKTEEDIAEGKAEVQYRKGMAGQLQMRVVPRNRHERRVAARHARRAKSALKRQKAS